MLQTKLSKSAELADNLAASVLLNQFFKELDGFGVNERREALQHIAIVIMASQTPSEA